MSGKTPQEAFAAAFGPWGEVGAAWAEAMSGLGGEVVRFLSERMQQDVGLQQRLMAARSLDEAQHVRAEFVQKAIDQYMEETGRVVEIGEELARRLGMSPLT